MNLVLLGISLGLLGIVGYLLLLIKDSAVPVSYVTQVEWKTNTVRQGYKILPPINVNWAMLESTNYVTYIRNLRGIGCPEETVRDIIIADIAKMYAERRTALWRQIPAPHYWESPDVVAEKSPVYQEVQAQLQQLDAEERDLVQELLGVNLDAELARYVGQRPPRDLQFDFLDPDKRAQVTGLLKKYDDLELDFYSNLDGALLPVDQAELRRLQQERDEELARVLSPEELFEFRLRHSDTARALRSDLKSFAPSEQEFREIFKLKRVLDETLNQRFDSDVLKDEEIRNRVAAEAQQAYNDELKQTLGEERFTEYQRSQDSDYRALMQIADRFALSKDKAAKIYEMKQAVEQQRQRILANPKLTNAKREAAFAGLQQESQKTIEKLIGQDAFFAYRQSGGDWITRTPPLVPESEPPQATVPPPGFVPQEYPPLPFPLPILPPVPPVQPPPR